MRLSLLHRAYGCLQTGYASVQIKREGSYSIERMADLYAFAKSTSTLRCIAILVVTPLPCLLCSTLIDIAPLAPPKEGIYANNFFWVRAFLLVACIAIVVFNLYGWLLPRLRLTGTRLVFMSIFVGADSAGYALAMAVAIGFPTPFTVLVAAPAWNTLFAGTLVFTWWRELRTSKNLAQEVAHCYSIVLSQLTLTIAYPAYSHVFGSLKGVKQTAFALLMPLMKLLFKMVFAKVLAKYNEDLRPAMVIFNVEVFHSLFVSVCMQTSTSLTTTGLLIVVDTLGCVTGIRSLEHLMQGMRGMTGQRASLVSPLLSIDTLKPLELFSIASQCAFIVYSEKTNGLAHFFSSGAMTKVAVASATIAPHTVVPCVPARMATRTIESDLVLQLGSISNETTKIARSFSPSEQQTFLSKSLLLLYMAEFLLLIEYVEVIMPVVYSGYLLIVFHLPNHAYYHQLASMTNKQLWGVVIEVQYYALFELLSFVLTCFAVRLKLGVSPIHHIAFVLTRQWQLVQGKLILWVLFTTQSTLEHFGYDYTFRFAWLKRQGSY